MVPPTSPLVRLSAVRVAQQDVKLRQGRGGESGPFWQRRRLVTVLQILRELGGGGPLEAARGRRLGIGRVRLDVLIIERGVG